MRLYKTFVLFSCVTLAACVRRMTLTAKAPPRPPLPTLAVMPVTTLAVMPAAMKAAMKAEAKAEAKAATLAVMLAATMVAP